jgi:hypothetical protein
MSNNSVFVIWGRHNKIKRYSMRSLAKPSCSMNRITNRKRKKTKKTKKSYVALLLDFFK